MKNIAFCFMSLFSLAVAAHASAQPTTTQPTTTQPLRYEVIDKHTVDAPAQFRLIANMPLQNVRVSISNCAPAPVDQFFESLASGETRTFQWHQPEGNYNCHIRINGHAANDTPWTFAADHVFASIHPIQLNVNLRELAPEMHDVTLHASRPMKKASIRVTAEDGSIIDTVEQTVPNTNAYKLSWTPSEKKPAMLEIKVWDIHDAWATNTIFYFQIPHTDIVFDTAKYAIRRDQEHHLKESLDKILDIIKTHERVAVDLYITGYTDTVGSAASNLKLSLNRAKAIAAWFKKNGLQIPTYYRGAGENSLAVPTPDETPNEQNRRAVYILSNRPPLDTATLGEFAKI